MPTAWSWSPTNINAWSPEELNPDIATDTTVPALIPEAGTVNCDAPSEPPDHPLSLLYSSWPTVRLTPEATSAKNKRLTASSPSAL